MENTNEQYETELGTELLPNNSAFKDSAHCNTIRLMSTDELTKAHFPKEPFLDNEQPNKEMK